MPKAKPKAAKHAAAKPAAKPAAKAAPVARTYPAWYYAPDGSGQLIRDANHHLDYPKHTADSPAAFGIETAPAAK